MKMVRIDKEWAMVLEAICPACNARVEQVKPPKPKRFPALVKCPNCGWKVDKVYFD